MQIKKDVHVPTGISTIPKYVQVIIDGKENFLPRSQVKEPKSHIEGSIKEVTLSIYERNRTARLLCIKHYGNFCQVCHIDFGEYYGDIGKGFIHVHHLKPIAKISNSYKVDPVKDLTPVCPNCHNMIHIKEPPLTIEQLKRKLR
ncbi:MAG: HNH endonuclease [bacterium]